MTYLQRLAARDCLVIAHRGIWQDAPENSLAAIEQAIRDGHDVVEIDIRRTRDGVLVLMHDETLLRRSGFALAVDELVKSDLIRLPLLKRPDLPSTETVPSLGDALSLCRGRILVHLDAKDRSALPDIIACATDLGMAEQVDIWGDLRSDRDLVWFREMVPPGMTKIARIWLDASDVHAQLNRLFALAPQICELRFSSFEQVAMFAPYAKQADIALMVNTLNMVACAGFDDGAAMLDPETVWGRLLDAGVSLIQTDEAAALQQFLTIRQTEDKT